MKTYVAKENEITQKWVVIDALDKVLGRLASQVATLLRGKDKAVFTPNQDTGDYVIVINAAHMRFTGNKTAQRAYYRHSMYPGGFRKTMLSEVLAKHPEEALRRAVKGMLTRGPLGNKLIKKLKVYAEGVHPHEAQVKGSQRPARPAVAAPAKPAEEKAEVPPAEATQPQRPTRRRSRRETTPAPASSQAAREPATRERTPRRQRSE